MYVKVKDIVGKCTEKSEGMLIYQQCQCSLSQHEMVNVDFDGINNVTDDFVFGFLGPFSQDKEGINKIHYVRIQAYIRNRFKRATRQIVAVR